MRQLPTKIVTFFATVLCAGCSIFGGSSDSAYLGKPAEDVSVSSVAGELEESFSFEDHQFRIRPLTRPLMVSLARAELTPKGASKKKISEKSLLYSAIFVDGYTCFDVSVRKPEGKKGRFEWEKYKFAYGYDDRRDRTLETRNVPHFERQRAALTKLLKTHLPESDCETKRCERHVFCGEHLHFSRSFRLSVRRAKDPEKDEIASVGWPGDEDYVAKRARARSRAR